MEKKADEYLM